MAGHLAIGGVSTTLRRLLLDRMDLPDGVAREQFAVTIGPPRVEQKADKLEEARVNLFLYRVTENAFLKNQPMPNPSRPGHAGRPPLALQLHYMVTGHGSTSDATMPNETRAHYLLGSAMRVLHDYPILTPALARRTEPVGEPILDPSLEKEVETIRITPEVVNLEDLSKVWTALTLPYRPAAVYTVSAVLIEPSLRAPSPTPVREGPKGGPGIVVVPAQTPRIQEVRVLPLPLPGQPAMAERAAPYLRVGDTLVLVGRGLGGKDVRVRLGDLEVPASRATDARAEVVVPDAELAGGDALPEARRLQPGLLAVELVVGVPGFPRHSFQSNRAAVMLVPQVRRIDPVGDDRVLSVRGSRLVHEGLSGETLLGGVVLPKARYSKADPAHITVPLPDTLPHRPVACLVSGPLGSVAPLGNDPDVKVRIGTAGPHALDLGAEPATAEELARVLQAAIRRASPAASFRGTRVAAFDGRVVVVPGGLVDTVTFTGSDAGKLGLTLATGCQRPKGHVSGWLQPFPALTARQPAVQVRVGLLQRDVKLPLRPAGQAEAAELLQAGLRQAGFAGAHVVALEAQLLTLALLPLTGQVSYAPLPASGPQPGDATSAQELQLHALLPLRVRVNGAESVDPVEVELPA